MGTEGLGRPHDTSLLTAKTPAVRPDALDAWPLASAALVAMLISIALLVRFTEEYALHLCGWNALIQCHTGTPLFWLVPGVTALVALRAFSLLVAWARGRAAQSYGIALTGWVVSILPLILVLDSRTFGPTELIAAGVWGTVGIGLLYWTSTGWRRRSSVISGALWLVVWIAFIRALQAMPSILLEAKLG